MPGHAANPTKPPSRPSPSLHLTSSSTSSLSSSPLLLFTYPNQLLGLPHGHYAGMLFLAHLLSLEDHVYSFGFSPGFPTALRLGWGTLRPLDICPEVHIGMGSFQNTLALVV